MSDDARAAALRELEAQHGIPPDRFCGMTAAEMSRAIVAHDAGPRQPGGPVGYDPIASAETRLGWLRDAFGPDADVETIRLRLQFFGGRVAAALKLDWMADNAAFERAVAEGLEKNYPDLSAEARAVIGGGYAYSHWK
ncbi:MAG: hypothetical protein ACKOC4_13925 [Planctomycetia bacterium]